MRRLGQPEMDSAQSDLDLLRVIRVRVVRRLGPRRSTLRIDGRERQ